MLTTADKLHEMIMELNQHGIDGRPLKKEILESTINEITKLHKSAVVRDALIEINSRPEPF